MKVFFYASPVSTKYDEFVNAMYDDVERSGYDQTNDEVKTHKVRDLLKEAQDGKAYAVDEYHKYIGKFLGDLMAADICVFEVSIQSLGSGYLIDKSLESSKPTIVLHHKNHKPHILSVVQDDKLVVMSYTDEDYLKVIKKALAQAREKRDKRFNFFLSPKLLNYIEEASKESGITKSKLLRDMIVRHMRENKEEVDE